MRSILIILWTVLALLSMISCIWIAPLFCKLVVLAFSCLNLPTGIALVVMDIASRRAEKKDKELLEAIDKEDNTNV